MLYVHIMILNEEFNFYNSAERRVNKDMCDCEDSVRQGNAKHNTEYMYCELWSLIIHNAPYVRRKLSNQTNNSSNLKASTYLTVRQIPIVRSLWVMNLQMHINWKYKNHKNTNTNYLPKKLRKCLLNISWLCTIVLST
jgi:hypothetical protein